MTGRRSDAKWPQCISLTRLVEQLSALNERLFTDDSGQLKTAYTLSADNDPHCQVALLSNKTQERISQARRGLRTRQILIIKQRCET
jgi:hypothetical protein